MRQILKKFRNTINALFLGIIVSVTTGNYIKAQSPCMPTVPSFTVDLTGSPAGNWASPNITRVDYCCSASGADNCVYFNLILDPNSAGIQIDMIGADPAGSLFYDIGCTGSYPGGQIKCITGVGPHQITFCKPGGNKNIYKITSISKPLFPKDDTIRLGCKTKLITLGVVNNSVTWQSIYPGALGQYNSYLDSTNVASPTYSPSSGAPPYVDYQVCGFPQASSCGFSVTVCDTVRIYNYPVLSGIVTPNPAMFCNIGPGSGVTLTATGVGGLPAYSYTWLTSANAVLGTGATYFATVAGSYKLEIKDRLYDPANCPSAFQSPITVSSGTTPIVDACPSQKLCASNPVASITGTVQYATGIWTGGAGTYNPGNTYMNLTYSPTPAEVAAGFVKLYLTSTSAGGGCVNQRDSTIIYFSSPLNVGITTGTLACNNSTTTLTGVVSGGTMPYYYQWNTGSTFSSITGGQGNYSLLVADSLGCTSSNVSTNVIAPTALNIIFTAIDCTTNGGNDGSASVSVSGGTPAYSVTWTPTGLNTFTITNLPFGIYTATIMDANGCLISGSTIVNQPPCLAFTSLVSSTNVLCNGDANGVATVTVSGGTPAYTYTWNTNPVQNTSTATNLNAGVYTVLIRDAINCLQTANVTITEPTPLTDVMTYTNNTIVGGSNGTASANPFGGTSPYTYLWNTAPTQTTSSISGLPAGTYVVNVTDNNGCVKTDSIRITEPPCNTNLNVFSSNVSCFGGSNGSAIAIVSGAIGSYTVSWSNGASGPTVAGLNTGNYLVTVTDAVNCVVFQNFSITQPSKLSVGLSPVNSRCNNLDNGTIDLTIAGGIFPYSFNWSNGSTAEDQVNLAPGSYSVQITDANGCSAVASASITEPAPLVVTYTSQNVSCIYGTNGSISLTASGGITPYFYSWSTGATTQNITNISAGGYSFSVTDANNCITNAPITIGITQPDSVMVNSFLVACSVPGSGQTQVTVVPSGGNTSTYQVSYDNGVTYQSPGVYTTMLNNGTTYSVIVRDANNCLSLIPDVITLLNEVKIDSISFGKCYAVGTTSVPVTVYPSGGDNGPYTVSFNNGSTYLAPGTYSSNISIATTYTVIIKDSRGCVSATQIITLPPIFNSTVSVTSNYNGQNVSCFGLTDGSALATTTGGTGSYSYTWTTIPTQTTSAATNLGAGTYSVMIQDGNNCIITKTITLTQPVVVTSTAVATSIYNGQNISCFGYSDGTASVTPNGGTTPYTYVWNTIPTQTTSTATGLSAGTYSVVVRDINNCSVTTTVTLIQPAATFASSVAIISNYNGQHVSCFGSTNASLTVTAFNGTGPYTYTWSTTPVQTGTLVTGLGAGTYSVVMNDINGCSITNTITVSEPLAVNATSSVTSDFNGQDISCFGLTNGSASITTTGGTTPYTYLWNSIPTQTTASASNLGAGTYSVTVTDVNGCTTIKTITLNQPTLVNAQIIGLSTFGGYNVSCFQSTNGYIDISANGGTGSYTYSWSNSTNTQDITNLGAGNYSVVVSDINGCKDSLTSTITEPNKLMAIIDSVSNYSGFNVSCFGSQNANIYVSVTGGVQNYNYIWSNNTSSQDLINIGVGSYTLLVSDMNLCSVSINTTLTQPPALTFTSSVTKPLCHGYQTAAINTTVGGGVVPYSYNWSNNASSEDISNIAAGIYSIKYTDKNGCKDSVTINVTQPDTITLAKVVQGLKCFGDTIGDIFLNPSGGTGSYTYQWSTGNTTKDLTSIGAGQYSVIIVDQNECAYYDTSNIVEPRILQISLSTTTLSNGHNVSSYNGNDGIINLYVSGGSNPYSCLWSNGSNTENLFNLTAGNYFVTVSDTNQCRVSGEITLTQPLILEMPQGFSPNGDGKNEFFIIHGLEAYPDNELTIYNRWGNIIYSKDGYLNDWDGTSNNGLALPDATYFAILEVNKGDKVLKGYVELRRQINK